MTDSAASLLPYGSIVPALQAYVLVFLALAVLTWAVYVRRGATMAKV